MRVCVCVCVCVCAHVWVSVYSINNSRYFSRGDSVISSLVPRLALQQLQQLDERLGRGCLLPMTLSQAAAITRFGKNWALWCVLSVQVFV